MNAWLVTFLQLPKQLLSEDALSFQLAGHNFSVTFAKPGLDVMLRTSVLFCIYLNQCQNLPHLIGSGLILSRL